MRLNFWTIPDGNISPHILSDLVLDRYTQGYGLHLSPEGRDLLRDLLLVVMEDYQDVIAEHEEGAAKALKDLETSEKALTEAKEENADLQSKVDALEKELMEAKRTIDIIQAGQARALMWKDAKIPGSWDKVTKEE